MKPFKVYTPDQYADKKTPSSRGRRKRPQPRTCITCRSHKIKCDRGLPCTQCSARGWDASCRYSDDNVASGVIPFEDNGGLLLYQSNEIRALRSRIGELEKQLKPSSPSPVFPTGETPPPLDYGMLQENYEQEQFLGSSHWALLANTFPKMRLFLSQDQAFVESQDALFRIKALHREAAYAVTDPLTIITPYSVEARKRELLACLPDPEIWNELSLNYFMTIGRILPMVDRAIFNQRYAAFLAGDETDMVWLLQLMTVFACGLLLGSAENGGVHVNLARRQGEAKALVKAVEFTLFNDKPVRKPSFKVLEILLLLIATKNILTEVDGPDGLCGILGMVAKLSFSLGLHRDPTYFTGISAVEVQRRRILWAIIRYMDMDYSVQLGVPQLIDEDDCDCQLPSTDENELGCDEVKPYNDAWFLHGLAKATRACCKVQRVISSPHKQLSLTGALKEEGILANAIKNMKEAISLKTQPIQDAVFDDTKMRALFDIMLDFIYYRTIMILYRPLQKVTSGTASLAWSKFLNAAMSMLSSHRDFSDLIKEDSCGWWRFAQTFLKNDICRAVFSLFYGIHRLHISDDIQDIQAANGSVLGGMHTIPSKDKMLSEIAIAKDLWVRNFVVGINYIKAYKLLCVVEASATTSLNGQPTLELMTKAAIDAMHVVSSVVQSSPSAIIPSISGARDHNQYPQNNDEYRHSVLPLASDQDWALGDTTPTSITVDNAYEWEWFDQLVPNMDFSL